MNKEKWKGRSISSNYDFKVDLPFILIFIILYIIYRNFICRKAINFLIKKSKIRPEDIKPNREKLHGSIYRASVYTFLTLYGLFVLKNENWIFDTFEYTLTWTDNYVPLSVRIYYYLEISHYTSSLIFIFYEPKMSDFMQMVIHHFVTLLLLTFSFYTNLLRYGIVIMFLHDISDPIMELAKIFLYFKNQKKADIFFCFFALFFITTRCFIYPILIVTPALYYGYFFGLNFLFILQICALVTLVLLNLIWSFYISKMVINYFKHGKVKGDIRIDTKENKKIKKRK